MLYDSTNRPIGPGVTDISSFGETMHEDRLKDGLKSLNPDIHFDMGGNLDIYHPRIDDWQGVFVNGRHICSMGRGTLPEYDVWHLDNEGERTHILQIGWRSTMQAMVNKVDNITWDNLCFVFGIEYKKFNGHEIDLGASI